MTRDEFNKSKMFGGMSMRINGNWKLVSSIDFETGIHEDSEGNSYPLDSIEKYSNSKEQTDLFQGGE
jgi:hypothetical protein